MSHVANMMISFDRSDRPTVEALGRWLETAAPKRGFEPGTTGFVGSLVETTGRNTLWGGGKYPECEVWAGALNHADLPGLVAQVERLEWRFPEFVQLFLQDQEEEYFRVWMFDGPTLRQLAPPEREKEVWPPSMSDVKTRFALAGDAGVLADMLVEAVNWQPGREFSREEVMADPRNARYVEGWPRRGDLGLVADTTWGRKGDEPFAVGAAWLRSFTADEPGYGFVAPDVPELSIAVSPSERGRGLGSVLITRLLRLAAESGVERVSLSVERDNPARRLYERHGFRLHRDPQGEDSVTMLADLRPRPVTGTLHHVEVWVPDLGRAVASFGWLLEALGHRVHQDWAAGRSWRLGSTYVVLEQSPALTADRHDRCRPGLNHLAFHVRDRAALDALVAESAGHGWTLMFPDRHPHAGGPDTYAAYLENADGFEVELVAAETV